MDDPDNDPDAEADDITNPVFEGPKKAATGVVVIAPAVALADRGRCSGPVAAAAAAAEASSGKDGSVTGGRMDGAAAAATGAEAISSSNVGSTTPSAEAPNGSRATAKGTGSMFFTTPRASLTWEIESERVWSLVELPRPIPHFYIMELSLMKMLTVQAMEWDDPQATRAMRYPSNPVTNEGFLQRQK